MVRTSPTASPFSLVTTFNILSNHVQFLVNVPSWFAIILPIPSEIRRIYGIRKWCGIFMHVNVKYIANPAVKIKDEIYITYVKFLLIY
jgi:hypothetical protein